MALSADQIVHALYQRGLDVGPNGGVSMRPGLPLEMRRDLARGFAMTGSYLSATESMLISEVRADLPAAVDRHRAEESAAARRAYEVRRAEQAAKVDPKAAQPARQAPPAPIATVSAMGMGDDLPFTPATARVIAPGPPPPAPEPATGATHPDPVHPNRDHDAARNAPLDRGADGAPRLAPSAGVGSPETAAVDNAVTRGRAVRASDVSLGTPGALDASRTPQAHLALARSVRALESYVVTCAGCGVRFTTRRTNTRTCGPTCRKRLSRGRNAPPRPAAEPPASDAKAEVTAPVTRGEVMRDDVTPPASGESSAVAPAGLTVAFDQVDGAVTVEDLQEARLIRIGRFDLLEGSF